ncbi:MAG: BirA family transcriptional regulator [Gammaproteobacteria bacterium]|jgi:BirA family biotin operon repressor/biotin-[acetyl-CoA-carboxylase] ligase|nr:BirA family transcriptional regulator [Gammaproteobacteria bacterium]
MAVSIASGLNPPSLLVLLADGRLHSGERLAQELGVSRAAVWKGILRLRTRGIDVEAVPRRGYRLPSEIELFDAASIRAAVNPARAERLRGLDLLFDVDSTNTRLLAAEPPPYGRADVVLAEMQHAGRGRRGRPWIAPFGGSIALSLAWSFRDASKASPALSLCVGVAVARALGRAGGQGIALKWPNDIWFGDRKVGGVLTELRAEASGPAHVVIGVGLNVKLKPVERELIEASGVRAAAVADACASPPSRNFIAGAIIDELLSMLAEFEREGFAAFRQAWTALDALHGRPARVLMGDTALCGTARGVDAHGALRLERDGRMEEFVSGDVSLRLDGDDI